MSVLPEDLVKAFVRETNDTKKEKKEKKESFMYGTVHIADNHMDILFDGATDTTPCTTTVTVEDGDRVLVMLKNREAVITANVSSPSINADVLEGRVVKARDKYRIDMIEPGGERVEADALTMSNVYFSEDDTTKKALTIGDPENFSDPDDTGLEAIQFVNDVYFKEPATLKTLWISDPEYTGYVWAGPYDLSPSGFNGHIVRATHIAGEIHNTSDRTLKHDIEDTDEDDALGKLNLIRHRKFVWNQDNKEETLGYIAQELREIDPKLAEGPDGYCSINNLHLIALATKAIQELSAKVDKLERRVEELESEHN